MASAAVVAVATPAFALPLDLGLLPPLDLRTAFGSAVIIGLVIFSTTLAILYVRERRRWSERDDVRTAELARLRGADDRAEILLGSERQLLIVWSGPNSEPAIEGDPTLVGATSFGRVLAFGSWLAPADAARLEGALGPLQERGQQFRLILRTAAGAFVEAEGRTVGARAALRMRDVSEDRSALLRADGEAGRANAELATLRALLDAVDAPIWLRGPDGRLSWVNEAYGAAVEAGQVPAAVQKSLELLDRKDRDASATIRQDGRPYRARVAAIVTGSRRVLDILEVPLPPAEAGGPARAGGIARDVSDLEGARTEAQLQAQAHVRMLDGLRIAVATFDGSQRLVFHNAAYRQLWNLDASFLEGRPTEGEILDRLRAARRLPEQADFRGWKATQLALYRSADPSENWWHLPDRRTLRVVTNPAPNGGLTHVFDDVSDRVDLESRVNSLLRVQRETLDTLSEGVAVFGSDGRLKLCNRAFASLWQLDPEASNNPIHIDVLVTCGRQLAPAPAPWIDVKAAVSGLSDRRERVHARMERVDGTVLDCAAEPLPDGATLLTFADVTATVNVERALTERNDALEAAGRLRNEFVHHVSYELRSPLTTVIGFSELLGAGTVGALNERQLEYADHITRSSRSLLAIINDILDLASIDTETIELNRERVDVLGTIQAAATGIEDRLVEAQLKLDIDVPGDIGSFEGDTKRVRQVLYNLLSNAVGFSSPGQTIRVTAAREDGMVLLAVSDEGRGIGPEMRERIFDRFESHTAGTTHRGVGLGLSIVRSFVELHGGHVELASERGAGTTVTCYFPADGRPPQQLAASVPSADLP